MDGSDSPYDSSLDRMLDVYAARISKLESDLAKARADLLVCQQANKECLRELSEAIADCKIVCHRWMISFASYVHDGRPPQKIINRYLPKEQRR